jgi:formylglycine-generating enzyme required for sulfatase activity
VLDKYCISCHDGSDERLPYLKGDKMITDWTSQISGKANPSYGGHFSRSYADLHRYVRRPGIESDMHMLAPMDVHADQTELIRILNKGHHNVSLDRESLEKLYCWIDFNAPYHGQRSEIPQYEEEAAHSVACMKENALKYAGMELAFDQLPEPPVVRQTIIPEKLLPPDLGDDAPAGWPMPVNQTFERQIQLGEFQRDLVLDDGIVLKMVKVPAGSFLMGSENHRDELPRTAVTIYEPFWIGRFEVTNKQFNLFDPSHDSRHEHRHGYQFGREGYPLNHAEQPVVRVSWDEAMAFCTWLTEKTGFEFTLPTEAQWEWACRAGSETDYAFGSLGDDFTLYANLGDLKLREFAACTAHKFYESARIIDHPNQYDDWIPHDTLYNDQGFVSMHAGAYRSNNWELFDMHGNVWEWTRSDYLPYPYNENDGRNECKAHGRKVVRGGSWYARPHMATSSYRLSYRNYQRIFDVGFRVVMMEQEDAIN